LRVFQQIGILGLYRNQNFAIGLRGFLGLHSGRESARKTQRQHYCCDAALNTSLGLSNDLLEQRDPRELRTD
jgi:hypothetical protein